MLPQLAKYPKYHTVSIILLLCILIQKPPQFYICLLMLALLLIHLKMLIHYYYYQYHGQHTTIHLLSEMPLKKKPINIQEFQSEFKKQTENEQSQLQIQWQYGRKIRNIDKLKLTFNKQQYFKKKPKSKQQLSLISENIVDILRNKLMPMNFEINSSQKQVLIKLGLSPNHHQICFEILNDHMILGIQAVLTEISIAYKKISNIINHCFSLGVCCFEDNNSNFLSIRSIKRLIQVVQRQNCLPRTVSSLLGIGLIKAQLAEVSQCLKDIPDVYENNTLLKMRLYVRHLQKQFPNQRIQILDSYSVHSQRAIENNHIFKLHTMNKISYSKNPTLFIVNCELLCLIFFLIISKKYYRSKKPILVELRPYIKN